MSEYLATLRETIVALAAADRDLKRFGAARHRYALAPPIADVDPALPDDVREYLTTFSGGGVGPYYGILAHGRAIEAPAGVTAWQHARPIGHLGCGYAALLVLDGPARGQIWIDARAIEVVAPIQPSFTAYYVDWIERLAQARWPADLVPPGRCALAGALSGYFGFCEQQLDIPAGSLAGDQLAAALANLGPGAIEIAAGDSPLFEPNDPVDPCVTCARLVENLAGQGLRPDVLRPGIPSRFDRG